MLNMFSFVLDLSRTIETRQTAEILYHAHSCKLKPNSFCLHIKSFCKQNSMLRQKLTRTNSVQSGCGLMQEPMITDGRNSNEMFILPTDITWLPMAFQK